MNICSIVARNYLAQVRVLAESFARHHPGARCVVLVIDDEQRTLSGEGEAFELVRPADVGIEDFDELRAIYNVLELSTALKPALLAHMLDACDDGTGVAYFDPDIEIHSRMVELERALERSSVVLTPHLLYPLPRDGRRPTDVDILQSGVYNLGFIALAGRPGAHALLDWWSERLERECIVAPERGYFVDQRWIDLAPGMVDDLEILRHPGYNVAYWNLPERHLTRRPAGGYRTGAQPLRFFHFSGYHPDRPWELSKHQDRVELAEHPALRTICDDYAQALRRSGFDACRTLPYAHDALPSGTPLTGLLRTLYREAGERGAGLPSPFTEPGEAALLAWAAGSDEASGLSRFLRALWEQRADLRAAFPQVAAGDLARYCEWVATLGFDQVAAPAALRVVPATVAGGAPVSAGAGAVVALAAPGARPVTAPAASGTPAVASSAAPAEAPQGAAVAGSGPRGVNVIGYLESEVGVGEIARQVVTALDCAGVITAPTALPAEASRAGHGYAAGREPVGAFPINVVCVNADVLPTLAAQTGDAWFAGRYTVGIWWWETDHFPPEYAPAFEHVDELWVGSRFIADALRPVSPVPVLHMPVPISFPDTAPLQPTLGRWPADAFAFLFSWDYNSVFGRKNPLGVVAAYMSAFGPDEGATLVLKCINAERDPVNHARLQAAVRGRPDIVVIDEYLDAADKDRLMASGDCYVSLHRSEGLGLTIAEAQFHGRPVIATGYSGSMELTDPETSFLVDYRLAPIGPGADPYPPHGRWAEPDLADAARLMREVFEQREAAAAKARRAAQQLRERYSPAACGAAMRDRLAEIDAALPAPGATATPVDTPGLHEVAHLLTVDGRQHDRSRFGWPGDVLRRLAHRVMRPHTYFQYDVNDAVGKTVGELHAHTEALAASVRAAEARSDLALAQTQALLAAGQRQQARAAADALPTAVPPAAPRPAPGAGTESAHGASS